MVRNNVDSAYVLTAEVHVAEGQRLLEEQILNKEKSLKYRDLPLISIWMDALLCIPSSQSEKLTFYDLLLKLYK